MVLSGLLSVFYGERQVRGLTKAGRLIVTTLPKAPSALPARRGPVPIGSVGDDGVQRKV
jgi:hypothetical protein